MPSAQALSRNLARVRCLRARRCHALSPVRKASLATESAEKDQEEEVQVHKSPAQCIKRRPPNNSDNSRSQGEPGQLQPRMRKFQSPGGEESRKSLAARTAQSGVAGNSRCHAWVMASGVDS